MFKTLSPTAIEEMDKLGDINISIKSGWEEQGDWQAKPAHVVYWIGYTSEDIFTCYYSRESRTLQITNIEPTSLIGNQKALVDAYLYIAIKGIIGMAEKIRVKRLIIDSFLPPTADHLLDLGFHVTSKGLSSGARGCKDLERT